MKILIAPDSFKGSLTAPEVAEAMAAGFERVFPRAEIVRLPLSDGGPGTVAAMVEATGGRRETRRVRGPLGEPVDAAIGILGDGITAVVEMAAASGLTLVPEERRQPRVASTFGTGELIAAALDAGCRRLIIGIGGSATNDGGAGAMAALGARFLDANGQELPPGGADLARLEHIDLTQFHRPHPDIEIVVACDVTNPLLGADGASAIYGPQKGASEEDIRVLDAALARYAEVVARDLGKEVRNIPGAGAAGGLGAGLMAFLDAKLQSGIEIVLDAMRFREHLRHADLVLTGEGRIDAQTAFGKTIAGISRVSAEAQVPVIAIGGSLCEDLPPLDTIGLAAAWGITPRPMSLAEAMAQARALLDSTAEQVARTLAVGVSLSEKR
jgi:glycerate 2-kinase